MRYWFRRLLRRRCWAFIGNGDMVYSMRNPDRLNEDGTITEGVSFAVHKAIVCHRRRWHRGEHVA